MTRQHRLLAVLVCLFLAFTAPVLVGASSAGAANVVGSDCLNPPNPTFPDGGVSGWIDPGPEKPVTGDPFAKPAQNVSPIIGGPKSPFAKPKPAVPTIYDVYGYAGTNIVSYDPQTLGVTCLSYAPLNDLNNLGMGVIAVLTAVCVRMYRIVMGGSLGPLFDPIQSAAQNIIGNGFFLPFVGGVVVASGVWLLWRANRSTVQFTTGKATKTVLIVCVGMVATLYPLTVGATFDKALGQVVTSASSLAAPDDGHHQPADSLAGSIIAAVGYSTWEQATFGSGPSNLAAADEFGPRLFKAAAYTRAEAAALQDDPSKAKDLGDAKREDYKTVAKEIEERYPIAYEYVKGDHSGTQFGFVLVGGVAAVLAAGFLILALTRFGYAMIIVRLAIGAAPAVAFVAAFPTTQHLMPAAFKVVWKALCNAAYFGVGVILYVVVGIGTILNPSTQLNPFFKLVALALLTYALIKGAKQFKLIAAEEKALQRARDARNGEDDPNRWGDQRPDPGEPAVEDPPYHFDAERDMPTHHPRAQDAGRLAITAGKTGALVAATAVTGGAAGTVAAKRLAVTATKTAATTTTKQVGGAAARQITSAPARQAAGTAKQIGSAARGSVIHTPGKGGRPMPGPSKAVTATRGVYQIHSLPGGKR